MSSPQERCIGYHGPKESCALCLDQERHERQLVADLRARAEAAEALLQASDIRLKLPWHCEGCGALPDAVEWARIDSSYWNGHVVGGSPPDVCGPFVFDDDPDGIRAELAEAGEALGEVTGQLLAAEARLERVRELVKVNVNGCGGMSYGEFARYLERILADEEGER